MKPTRERILKDLLDPVRELSAGWCALTVRGVDHRKGVNVRVRADGQAALDVAAATSREDNWLVATCTGLVEENVIP